MSSTKKSKDIPRCFRLLELKVKLNTSHSSALSFSCQDFLISEAAAFCDLIIFS